MNLKDNAEGLPFRDDFAARVLIAADRATARQRRLRWGAATATASLVAVVFIAAPWRGAPAVSSVRSTPPQIVARAEPDLSTFGSTAQDTQTDPLGYMFPDAEPLSRFSAQYSSATSAGQDSGIFSEESEEAGGS